MRKLGEKIESLHLIVQHQKRSGLQDRKSRDMYYSNVQQNEDTMDIFFQE
ncbi:hypothetical protein [Chryseobacterium sp. MP_3.2]